MAKRAPTLNMFVDRRRDGVVLGRSSALQAIVDHPVAVIVGTLMLLLVGFATLRDIPVQLTPDVSRPTLSVETRWRGAAPATLESDILIAQEDALEGIDGLREMTAQARNGLGRITLEFDNGTDIDEAFVRASTALGAVGSYPEMAEDPILRASGVSEPPLAVIGITARDGSDPSHLRTWVQERIAVEYRRLPGVAQVDLMGGRPTEIRVEFDPHQLAARQINVGVLIDAVQRQLRDVSAGGLSLGRRHLLVRTLVAPTEVEDLGKIVLQTGANGSLVTLDDVATVRLGMGERDEFALCDQRPGLVLFLTRQPGSNVLETTEAIAALTDSLSARHFEDRGLAIDVLSDQSGYIRSAFALVRENLVFGAVLAMLVLVLFLRSARASAIVALSIPICVVATLLGMTVLGRSINVVSLAGLTFAIGMVLDNSIISLEAIDTAASAGETPSRAAVTGVRRVWGALLASTATTVVVFIPIAGWDGVVGQLLRDVAVAVSLAVATSLVVSLVVIPALAGRLPRRPPSRWQGPVARLGAAGRGAIGGAVKRLVRSPRASVLAVLVTVLGALAVTTSMLPPLEYLPDSKRDLVLGVLIPPPGTAIGDLQTVGADVQAELAAHTGVERDGLPAIRRSFFEGDATRIFAGAVLEDPTRAAELVPFLRKVYGQHPGIIASTGQASLFGRGAGRTIDIDIVGPDLTALGTTAGAVFRRTKATLHGAQVRPIPSLDLGAAEIEVVPRRQVAAAVGIGVDTIGQAVDTFVTGAVVGDLSPGGETQVDVVVQAHSRDGTPLTDPAALAATPLATTTGTIVPLDVVAAITEAHGPTIISRIDRRRAIRLEVTPPDDVPLETAIDLLNEEVLAPLREAGELAPDVEVELGGSAGDIAVARDAFVEILLLALAISYLLLTALFGDFFTPIIVLVTIPIAAAGGVLALWLVDRTGGGQPLDLMTAIGFVILVGLVVNNAILIVDGARRGLAEQLPLVEAVRTATTSRIRPIAMTTATSLAGLLPVVLADGPGSELYRGIGAIVLGGLVLSTVLALLLVPCLFAIVATARAVYRRY